MKRLVITVLCAFMIASFSLMAHAKEIYWDQNSPPDVTTKDKDSDDQLVGIGLDKLGTQGIYDMPQATPQSDIDPRLLGTGRQSSPMSAPTAPIVRRSRSTIETPRPIRRPRSSIIEQPRPVERAVTPGNDPITEDRTPQSKPKGPTIKTKEGRDKSGLRWGKQEKPAPTSNEVQTPKEKKDLPWGKVDVKPSGPSEGGLKWGR